MNDNNCFVKERFEKNWKMFENLEFVKIDVIISDTEKELYNNVSKWYNIDCDIETVIKQYDCISEFYETSFEYIEDIRDGKMRELLEVILIGKFNDDFPITIRIKQEITF